MELYNQDNLEVLRKLRVQRTRVDLVYADMIYDDPNPYHWLVNCFELLKPNGIFIVQTDYHTVTKVFNFMNDFMTFVNWVIYKQEWGGVPRNRFAQKHDDILIFAKGDKWKWHGERIQIPKATAGTAFDKKGTGLKTPCSVFDDLGNFSTMSKERVKVGDKNIRWQKPMKLMNRLLLPFTDEGDVILDPFMGTGTTGVWAVENKRDFIGIDNNEIVYEIADQRILKAVKGMINEA